MKNNKMYLTQSEADAKGLPSTQEQIDRYNAALTTNRTPQEAAIMLRLAKEGVHPSDIDRRTAEENCGPDQSPYQDDFRKCD